MAQPIIINPGRFNVASFCSRPQFIQSSCPKGIFTLQLLFSLGPILLLWFGEQSVTLAVVAAAGSCSAARAQGWGGGTRPGHALTSRFSFLLNYLPIDPEPFPLCISCFVFYYLVYLAIVVVLRQVRQFTLSVCLWWMQRSWKTSGVYIYIAESFGFQ